MKKIANLNGVKTLSKKEQKSINGSGKPGSGGGCCNPSYSCCVPNPNYNGSNCQFVPGNPYAFPVPYCI